MKRGTPRHPKTYALAEALGVRVAEAAGLLEMLWHQAAQLTPRGDIGSLPDGAIAQGCTWHKKPSALLDALRTTGWIDSDEQHRIVIHDWPDHCDEYVKKVLRRGLKDFLPVYGKSLYDEQTLSGQMPDKVRPSRVARQGTVLEELESSKTEKTSTRDVDEPRGARMRVEFDDQWQELQRAYEKTGKPLIAEDWAKAHFLWRVMDHFQKNAALSGVGERVAAGQWDDANFIPLPEKYLRSEYKRAVIPRTNGNRNMSREELITKALKEA